MIDDQGVRYEVLERRGNCKEAIRVWRNERPDPTTVESN